MPTFWVRWSARSSTVSVIVGGCSGPSHFGSPSPSLFLGETWFWPSFSRQKWRSPAESASSNVRFWLWNFETLLYPTARVGPAKNRTAMKQFTSWNKSPAGLSKPIHNPWPCHGLSNDSLHGPNLVSKPFHLAQVWWKVCLYALLYRTVLSIDMYGNTL